MRAPLAGAVVLLLAPGCVGPGAESAPAVPKAGGAGPGKTAPEEKAPAEAGAPPHLSLSRPAAGMGRIRFDCDPPQAEVMVDGVSQGLASDFAAPGGLDLPPGLHRIELHRSGFATWRTEVVVSDEVTETIPVKLRPLPARAAARKENGR